jgi:hypothetical protein
MGDRLRVRRDRRWQEVKLANIVDEHTREALAMRVGRRCTADDLVNATPAPVGLRAAAAAHGP